jgi:hypothetical protein
MTTDTTELYYDPYDYDVEVDAQSIWKRLRDEAPVYWTRGSSSTRSASTTTCIGLTAADISDGCSGKRRSIVEARTAPKRSGPLARRQSEPWMWITLTQLPERH